MVCFSNRQIVLGADLQFNDSHRRQIRSFIRRDSRMTSGQQNAIAMHWAGYGLEITQQPVCFKTIFGNTAPVILDIGFGNGEALANMAVGYPGYNFIGIETHKPGVGHLLIDLARHELSNVRVYNADAIAVLGSMQDNSVSGVHVFFPDPWQKRRHRKRRLINPTFTQQLSTKLCCGGYLFIATDWQDYAQSIHKILSADSSSFQEVNDTSQAIIPIPDRPTTKFELRGLRLGHSIHEFKFFKRY